jgi:DNA polymerase-4
MLRERRARRSFERDLSVGAALREALEPIVDAVWARIERSGSHGRRVTLKLRLADYRTLTRTRSFPGPAAGRAEFARPAANCPTRCCRCRSRCV